MGNHSHDCERCGNDLRASGHAKDCMTDQEWLDSVTGLGVDDFDEMHKIAEEGINRTRRLTAKVTTLKNQIKMANTTIDNQDADMNAVDLEVRSLRAEVSRLELELEPTFQDGYAAAVDDFGPDDLHISEINTAMRLAWGCRKPSDSGSPKTCDCIPGICKLEPGCKASNTSANEVPRRIADRGLAAAEKQENSEMIDLWQHMLDELKRSAVDGKQEPIRDAICLDSGCDIDGKEPHKPWCDNGSVGGTGKT